MQDAWFQPSADSRRRSRSHVISGCCNIWRGNLGRFQTIRECEPTVADADHVSGFNDGIATHTVCVDIRAIATSQIAYAPLAAGVEDFTVVPAARIILKDNAIRGRPTNCGHLPESQAHHISPNCTIPCEEEGHFVGGQHGDFGVWHGAQISGCWLS